MKKTASADKREADLQIFHVLFLSKKSVRQIKVYKVAIVRLQCCFIIFPVVSQFLLLICIKVEDFFSQLLFFCWSITS